jgi:DNA-directed RNA polymerase specialized sigma24 family protein
MSAERDVLLAAASRAGRSGDHGRRTECLQLAVYESRGYILRRVARKVPAPLVDEVADAAAVRAVAQIAKAPPRADAPAAFCAWLRRLVDREIADHWRHAMPTVAIDDLAEEPATTDNPWEVAHRRQALRAALDAVPRRHRARIYQYALHDRPAAEVCGDGLTLANVYKTAERYRTRLRRELG